jgi:hypothetical protein
VNFYPVVGLAIQAASTMADGAQKIVAAVSGGAK